MEASQAMTQGIELMELKTRLVEHLTIRQSLYKWRASVGYYTDKINYEL